MRVKLFVRAPHGLVKYPEIEWAAENVRELRFWSLRIQEQRGLWPSRGEMSVDLRITQYSYMHKTYELRKSLL